MVMEKHFLWFQLMYAIYQDYIPTYIKYTNQNCTDVDVPHIDIVNTLSHVSVFP